MSAHLLGIGTARPAHSIAQPDAARMAVGCCARTTQQARILPTLYRRTTVERRASTVLRAGSESSTDPASWDWFYPSAAPAPHNADHATHAAPHTNGNGAASEDPSAASSNPIYQGPTTAARLDHYRRHAPPLAIEASRNALTEAGVEPDAVTHLVVVTCTGFTAPGVDFELIRGLGLRPDVSRTQVGFMGCHAAINGLRVAAALAQADPDTRVLMCCVELCSLHFQYGWHSERVTANALFADGAAAVVIGPQGARNAAQPPPAVRSAATTAKPAAAGRSTSPHAATPRIADTASVLIPDTEDEMSWRIGDHGFVMTLSSRVPQLIGEHARPWVDDWLGRNGLTVEDVGSWAIHPGGPRILSAVTKRLGLDEPAGRQSRQVLSGCGNMSSATVLFILERLRDARAPMPRVLLAFGPGLVAEAALLDF